VAVGAVVAVHQRSAARTQARIADGQRISEQALGEDDLARSLLLARQGFALADSPITRGNMLAALLRWPAAIAVIRHEPGPVTALDLSPDGRTLAVGSAHIGVEFIDTATRRRIGRPILADRSSIVSLRFSTDGARVAVASYDRQGESDITLVDARTHRRRELDLQLAPQFLGALGAIAFSPDSRVLAADYTAIPEVPRKRRVIARWDVRTGRALGAFQPIGSSPDTPHALAGFVAGGTRVVTSSVGRGGTAIRDARTLRPLRRFRAGGSIGDLSADGHYAVLMTSAGATDLLDLRTGGSRRLAGPRDSRIEAARFTPDSRVLVTDDAAGRLLVWDPGRAAPIATVDPQAGLVHRIAISADGRTAYTAGDDGNVIAWDLAGGRRLGRPFVLGGRPPPTSPPSRRRARRSPSPSTAARSRCSTAGRSRRPAACRSQRRWDRRHGERSSRPRATGRWPSGPPTVRCASPTRAPAGRAGRRGSPMLRRLSRWP
jgi:WD40 repeat protein